MRPHQLGPKWLCVGWTILHTGGTLWGKIGEIAALLADYVQVGVVYVDCIHAPLCALCLMWEPADVDLVFRNCNCWGTAFRVSGTLLVKAVTV